MDQEGPDQIPWITFYFRIGRITLYPDHLVFHNTTYDRVFHFTQPGEYDRWSRWLWRWAGRWSSG